MTGRTEGKPLPDTEGVDDVSAAGISGRVSHRAIGSHQRWFRAGKTVLAPAIGGRSATR